jgi:hypothetical protein
MSLQKAVTIYIDCLESPPNGNGRHYVEHRNGAIFFSEQLLGSLYDAYGEDQANAELDRQFKERRANND